MEEFEPPMGTAQDERVVGGVGIEAKGWQDIVVLFWVVGLFGVWLMVSIWPDIDVGSVVLEHDLRGFRDCGVRGFFFKVQT